MWSHLSPEFKWVKKHISAHIQQTQRVESHVVPCGFPSGIMPLYDHIQGFTPSGLKKKAQWLESKPWWKALLSFICLILTPGKCSCKAFWVPAEKGQLGTGQWFMVCCFKNWSLAALSEMSLHHTWAMLTHPTRWKTPTFWYCINVRFSHNNK